MTIKTWRVTISGHDADGFIFNDESTHECEFIDTLKLGMKETFWRLTEGRAQFGKPGVGCKGPYSMTRALIEEVKQ